LLLFIANQALGDPKHGDSGLYHFPAIQWITSFPIVPGLGNLHEWLGFNQSYFLYASALNIGPSILQDYHLANSLLLMALAMELFYGGHRQNLRDRLDVPVLLRWVLILPLAYYCTSIVNVSSPTPDTAVFVIGILVFIRLADVVFSDRLKERYPSLLMILFLVPLLITLKLTLVVFSVGVAATAIGVFPPKEIVKNHRRLLVLIRGLTLSVVLLITWFLRGIVTSGYPLFPSTVFGFPVDWRVPDALATNISNVVRSWARVPGEDLEVVLGTWDWIHQWGHSFLYEHAVLLCFLLIGSILTFGLYLNGVQKLPLCR
jgi:hypothetical protein